jgi:hypothetical protein
MLGRMFGLFILFIVAYCGLQYLIPPFLSDFFSPLFTGVIFFLLLLLCLSLVTGGSGLGGILNLSKKLLLRVIAICICIAIILNIGNVLLGTIGSIPSKWIIGFFALVTVIFVVFIGFAIYSNRRSDKGQINNITRHNNSTLRVRNHQEKQESKHP